MDAGLREGIGLFNEGKFFQCHEVLEDFYHQTEEENKAFVEGLIGLAAAFRLFCEFGEVKGPVRLIYQALIRLENYQPAFLQIHVKDLCVAAEAWAKAAEVAGAKPSAADIPKVKFQRFSFFS
jgi:predicted metal-dependent hydrolase